MRRVDAAPPVGAPGRVGQSSHVARRRQRRTTGDPGAAGLVLVRLGQLGLRHDHRHGAHEPLPHDRRRGGRLSRPARRPGLHDEPLRARHPRRAGVAVVLHRDLHDDPLRDRPDLHRRHRRPQPAPDPPAGRVRVGRSPGRQPDVLRRGHRTGSWEPRSSSSPASASAPRSSSTTRSCAASPTRTSATASPRRAGRSATSAAASCSRSTSPWTSSTRTSGSTGPCRHASASCPQASGGPVSRSSPTSACVT